MARRNLAVDLAVAVLVLGLTLVMLQGGGFGASGPGVRPLDALGVLLAAAASLPLVARRQAPLTAYGLVAAASLVLDALDYGYDFPFGPLVGVYSLAVAYGGDPKPVRRWSALLAAAIYLPAAAGLARFQLDQFLPELLFSALLFAGAWIAGDRARLRRDQLAQLEDRARRAEREAERERMLAAAEERTRIARELHDSAGHAINVILVQAGAARLLHEQDPAASRRAISTVEEVARETIGEIDRLVRALRDDDGRGPPPADPAELTELLERHRAGGMRIATELDWARAGLPRSVAWAGHRILQEALTNAARHGTGDATVRVCYRPEAVEITVTNPTGTNGSAPRGGHGIVGMRERASLLGGSLETATDNGTFRLHARLPYTEAQHREAQHPEAGP